MIFEQNNFGGGADLISIDTAVAEDAYVWLVNGRSRYGEVEPVHKAREETRIPAGKKQGLIAVGTAVVAFVAGKAYFKLNGGTSWALIPLFSMSTTADHIYSELVPVAAATFMRKLNPSGSVNDKIVLDHETLVNGMPSGVVCQDGVNQPWLLTFNETYSVFLARELKTFATWTITSQEYVPIGKQMMYMNGKLFIVSADGTLIYHSVTGQPLNFMVNIDTNGNKAATEAEGGAATVSFAFDYNAITCIRPVNVSDSFIYGTQTNVRVITLDYTRTIFGEPLPVQAAIIDAGISNQNAIAEISGDYAFGNFEGLRTFNAVQQAKFEGRNTVFSRGVYKLFKDIRQDDIVAIPFDNYVLFSATTTVGDAIVVFDSALSKWVGIDMLGIGKITDFTIVDLPSEVHLYVTTDTNKIYELYSQDTDAEVPYLYTRAFTPIDLTTALVMPPVTDIKSQKIDLIFARGSATGNVYCSEVIDGIIASTLYKPLAESLPEVSYTLNPALQPLISSQGERVTFNFNSTSRGYKLSYIIKWDTSAKLQKIRLQTTDINQRVSNTQQSSALGSKQV